MSSVSSSSWRVCPSSKPRGHHDRVLGGLVAHRHDRGPGLGQRAQQRPDLGPFGLRELQVGVVDAQQPGTADQGERHGQPQRFDAFQIPHRGPGPLGQRLPVEPGGGQRAVDAQPRLRHPLRARPQQPAHGTAEPPLEQGPFPQVLGDGQGGLQVGDTGHMGQRAEPADGRHLLRQLRLPDPRLPLGGLHPPGEREQQTRTPRARRPLDRDQRAGLRVDADTAERPPAGPLEPEVLGPYAESVRTVHNFPHPPGP